MADIISTEYSNLPCFTDVIDLLNVLDANTTFTTDEPSSSFTDFLEHIETAVPSPAYEEDDMYESWGHKQFTGGQLTCTTVLKTWACVGSPSFAGRLIAAAITTCRVSRWACKTRTAPMPLFFNSNNYLNETCRLLWDCWKLAGGVSVSNSLAVQMLISPPASPQRQAKTSGLA